MAVTQEELEQAYKDHYAELLEVDINRVDLSQDLAETGVNSLDMVHIVSTLIRTYRIDIPREAFDRVVTGQDIITLLMEHQA
ncbi:acyl carrier protein [Magnetococcales bacterium HHB-1]